LEFKPTNASVSIYAETTLKDIIDLRLDQAFKNFSYMHSTKTLGSYKKEWGYGALSEVGIMLAWPFNGGMRLDDIPACDRTLTYR
jgi:hypothetical protein